MFCTSDGEAGCMTRPMHGCGSRLVYTTWRVEMTTYWCLPKCAFKTNSTDCDRLVRTQPATCIHSSNRRGEEAIRRRRRESDSIAHGGPGSKGDKNKPARVRTKRLSFGSVFYLVLAFCFLLGGFQMPCLPIETKSRRRWQWRRRWW